MNVTTRCSSVQWGPQLAVLGIDIGIILQQQLQQLFTAINTTLKGKQTTSVKTMKVS